LTSVRSGASTVILWVATAVPFNSREKLRGSTAGNGIETTNLPLTILVKFPAKVRSPETGPEQGQKQGSVLVHRLGYVLVD
jgi:hypothetical protein